MAITALDIFQRISVTTGLSFDQWLICIGLALTLLVVEELVKLVVRRPHTFPNPCTRRLCCGYLKEISSSSFNLRNRQLPQGARLHASHRAKFLLRPRGDLEGCEVRRLQKPHLTGKNIALIFEKTSSRTRTAFEVAAKDQGAHITYLDPGGTQIGHRSR